MPAAFQDVNGAGGPGVAARETSSPAEDADSSRSADDAAVATSRVPQRPALEGLEERWSRQWEEWGTYRFDASRPRDEVFAIDTPPPTVSGSLHVGHVFSFAQTDVVARFWRMRGKALFYPIGWDDNGLATERRVQNHFGVRCDPSQPYDASFATPSEPAAEPLAISRLNFIELCRQLTAEDEQAFEGLFRRIGLSVDWSLQYTTIGESARRISQRAFLRMLADGQAYRHEAPTLWDVDFRSAIAQAELADKEVAGAYHRIRFARRDGGPPVEIETTRPELIPACVALVAHPNDERYRPLFDTTVLTPLFGVEVPVLAHHLAEPEKGSGIAMVCTFGDLTDVTWWRELSLPTRSVVGRNGRLEHAPFGEPGWESVDPGRAGRCYAELEGRTVKAAQRRIVELLRDSGDLVGEPRPITHFVKFYEKGERPLEIVSSRQWYVRTMALRERLLAAGRELAWHPEFMRARYESWVEGLNGDWNISRQRFFGVPFPVWYPVRPDGSVDDDHPILAPEKRLPVDPSAEAPDGYDESQRGLPGGFVGDPDVMDTWATSSLTPHIAARWEEDGDVFGRVFPMDLRPQGHDIIRTWLFTTVVRSLLLHEEVPWHHAALSGWILDPDRKKMSKSTGNVVVPTEPLDKHGTDAVRYWAASARLGVDTAFDEQQMVIGRKLAMKVLQASKFVVSRLEGAPAGAPGRPGALAPLDAAMLGRLALVVAEATSALEGYDHARALERVEQFFWTFCDDYLELVKGRVYANPSERAELAAGAASARYALGTALGALLRLFAPFLPFATEEAWSWWREASVHRAPWPLPAEVDPGREAPPPELLDHVGAVLGEVRRAKTTAKRSMKVPVRRVVVTGPAAAIGLIGSARGDLADAGRIAELELVPGEGDLRVEVELAEE
ncbi:MAG TPA: valine--tRNA ligase [Acidimicrobiales bacterium]|nr:valine--tRNA ligase [Acidimicrobiales bacterium]